MNSIQKADLANLDFKKLQGANIVFDGAPVGVVMSFEYYAKLQGLLKELKKQLEGKLIKGSPEVIDGGKF